MYVVLLCGAASPDGFEGRIQVTKVRSSLFGDICSGGGRGSPAAGVVAVL